MTPSVLIRQKKEDFIGQYSMHGGNIEPFYFGTSGKELFGCYHAPQSVRHRDSGVLLCYPMGEEYIRFHRAYRQLAVHLSKIGFPVLRFDFYGCGDSIGDFEKSGIRRWLIDISAAIDELRRRCGVTKVCLVGFRLGGALSMLVGAERCDIDSMVLWDPVVSGRSYIEEMTALHQRMLRYSHVKPKHHATKDHPNEILGFPFTDSMFEDLENIDLLAIRQRPANNILVVESHEKVSQERLKEHLKSMDTHVVYEKLPNPQIWIWIEDFGKILVPSQILQFMVSWLSEVYP